MRNSIPPNFANFAVGELFGNVQTTHVDLCLSVGGGRGTVSWAPPSANQAGWQREGLRFTQSQVERGNATGGKEEG